MQHIVQKALFRLNPLGFTADFANSYAAISEHHAAWPASAVRWSDQAQHGCQVQPQLPETGLTIHTQPVQGAHARPGRAHGAQRDKAMQQRAIFGRHVRFNTCQRPQVLPVPRPETPLGQQAHTLPTRPPCPLSPNGVAAMLAVQHTGLPIIERWGGDQAGRRMLIISA